MINKFSDVPLYVQLKNLIVLKIENGEFAENCQIPSEQELCDRYCISRPTVRQAISELTSAGYLHKQKGKGTFVTCRETQEEIENFSGFSYSFLGADSVGRDFISIKKVDAGSIKCISSVFDVDSESTASFAEVKTVVQRNERVICFNTSYIPIYFFPDIIEDIRQNKPSYDILKNKYPYVPINSKTVLDIVCTENGDSHILQLQLGQPILKAGSYLYNKSGQLVEYIVSKFRMDRCSLTFDKSRL